jgi:hypothetical protein
MTRISVRYYVHTAAAEELKESTMGWIERPRIHQDAVDTTGSEGG